MPNPKVGTVTDDIEKAVTESKAGKVEYRTDRQAIVHMAIGKASFDEQKLLDNYTAVIEEIVRAKPSSAKGRYILSGTLTTTMGPGIRVDAGKTGDREPAAAAAERRRDSRAPQRSRRPPRLPPPRDPRPPAGRRARKPGAGETMNRDEKAASNRGDRRPDRGRRGDLRGRLPRHQRPPGGRAARASCARPTPASASSRTGSPNSPPSKAGEERLAELLQGPTALTFVRGDTAAGGEGDLDLQPRARGPRLQGRLHGRPQPRRGQVQVDRPPAGPRRPRRPARRRRRQPADRPGPRPRLDDPASPAARPDRREGLVSARLRREPREAPAED